MKNLPIILSSISLVGVLALTMVVLSSKPSSTSNGELIGESSDSISTNGMVVYFNLNRIINEYDMANDLRSVVETKFTSISQELNRRGTKLEQDIRSYQDKINKGTITSSVAAIQSQKLSEQQNEFQTYYNEKQQEMAEEQMVMENQIMDAINEFIIEYNAEKQYTMIFATQGDILSYPLVTGDTALDITEDLLEGLNAAYVKTKSSKK